VLNEVILGDPNTASGNVTVSLQTTAASGKIYTVKNINAGGFNVLVTADIASRIEDPTTGSFVTSFNIANTGSVYTWVNDSGYYRRIY
jgi:hypothetical protein